MPRNALSGALRQSRTRRIIAHEEFAMTKSKKRAATVHFDPDLWDRVEQLAQQERRPVSQLLRNLIADAVPKSNRETSAGSDMVAA
jgi:macrodomain Ter protein organizer (MatP/YcbG family)